MKSRQKDESVEPLRAELLEFQAEKERIRELVGQIGGKNTKRRDAVINIAFVVVVTVLFTMDVLRHLSPALADILPPGLLLELGILLVSVKIVWMMHRQAKVEHFQFWILSSIEFRLNDLSRQMNELASGSGPGRDHGD